MEPSAMPQMPTQPVFVFNNHEAKNNGQLSANVALPCTPIYQRSETSCSQPPTLLSNGPSVMTPVASPPAHKAAILLDTDVHDMFPFPATPPLSTSGSAVGSPKAFDVLQTPVNPMFSGLDGLLASKDLFDSVESSFLDWSSCGSPPMTPVYVNNVSVNTVDIMSVTSCPSLSPSPAPYARSVTSEQGADFCDPRNLTVSGGPANPTLSTELRLTGLGEEQMKCEPVSAQTTFDFNASVNGLPAFEELSELDSEDDFSTLVNLGGSVSDVTRPRACTGSSIVSLGHGSFIGDDDLSLEDGGFFSTALPSPQHSTSSEDAHKHKKQKKSYRKDNRSLKPTMTCAAGEARSDQSHGESIHDDSVDPDSACSSGSEDASTPAPAPTSRRGRKQSLTEDPSKTFVCDLCNRRFRRQEHLKRHYRSLHTQEKPFECNECGKKFSRSDNLAQHARTHSSGAILMGVLEEGEQPPSDASSMTPSASDDFTTYGKVLFQIASEVPGSSSDSSEETEMNDQNKKKRKRSD